MKQWIRRLLILGLTGFAAVGLFLFVLFPVAGSFLLTNSRFEFPEPGPRDPAAVGLPVSPVEFASSDGIALRGWWSPAEGPDPRTLVFVHGLNRSRLELLERAVEAHRSGYGVLLFDLRNHGESQSAHTTLGIHESRDVCAAVGWVRETSPETRIGLWGVSLGASTALLAAESCGDVDAVIADSAFLSFDETIRHHFRLIFRLPSFPAADLLIAYTRWRLDLDPDAGDVERAVTGLARTPILFIAGGSDRRMPPELAARLFAAARHPDSRLVVVDDATHGQAFRQDPAGYLQHVFGFLADAWPSRRAVY